MSKNKRVDSTIVAALIGVLGTLCVTLISLYVNNFAPRPEQPTVVVQPTWTVPSTSTIAFTAEPTSTVPVGEPTSTPAPDTPTPEPTITPAPPAIGADWVNNCISILWRPYPNTIQPGSINGCMVQPLNMSEPVNLFFMEGGSLKFQVSRTFEAPQVYGLFAPIPSTGTVRIDTTLRRLQEGELWVGVFAEPDIAAQGLIAVLPSGENVRNRQLVQRKMPEQAELHLLETFADDPSQDPPRYTLVFEMSNGEVRVQKIGETEFSAVPVPSAQLWLFVGYQVAAGNNRMDAEFMNLNVQGQ